LMKFPNLQNISGYARLLQDHGCAVLAAEDTGRFVPYIDLYLNMIEMQLTYDALRIVGFDAGLLQTAVSGFTSLRELARAGKIAQARFIARRS